MGMRLSGWVPILPVLRRGGPRCSLNGRKANSLSIQVIYAIINTFCGRLHRLPARGRGTAKALQYDFDHPHLFLRKSCTTYFHLIASPNCQFKKQDFLFCGRTHPDKGAHLAIAIAERSNCPLIMAGPIQDSDYHVKEVVPHLDGTNVLYLCNVSQRDGPSLLGEARALLHPILF